MIYLFLIILLGCLTYHYDYCKRINYRISWYVICWLLFVLIAGLRYRLGIDTVAYESGFKRFPTLFTYWDFDFDSTRYGKGFLLLTAICKSIIDDFVFFQIIHAIFINTVIFYFFYKYTKHIYFALLLYLLLGFFPYNFEVLRESCAVAMLLIAWKYFLANKWIKYYLCIIVAVFFHPSALICATLPILYLPPFRPLFKIGKNLIITLSILFVVGTIVSTQFFDILSLVNLSTIEEYSDMYQDSNYGESLNLNIIGFLGTAIKCIIYPLAIVVIIKHSKNWVNNVKYQNNALIDQYNKIEYMLCWYMYISIMTIFLFIFYRFNNYFYPFLIIALSDAMFSTVKIRKKKIRFSFYYWMIFISPFIFVYAYTTFFHQEGESGVNLIRRYYPYESVIFKEKNKEREELYRFLLN